MIKKMEKYELILFISTLMKTGRNVATSLDYFHNNIAKSDELKDTIAEIILGVQKGSKTLNELLLQNKIITEFEYAILYASKDDKTAYLIILDLASKKSAVDNVYLMWYSIFTLCYAIVFFSLPLLIDVFQPFVDILSQNSAKFKLDEFSNFIHSFKDIYQYVAYFFVFMWIAGIVYFKYSYNYDIKSHYIMFKYKAINDAIIYLSIMESMLKSGMQLHRVADIFSQHIVPVSVRPLFFDMHKGLKNGQDVMPIFKTLGLDNITLFILKSGLDVNMANEVFSEALSTLKEIVERKRFMFMFMVKEVPLIMVILLMGVLFAYVTLMMIKLSFA